MSSTECIGISFEEAARFHGHRCGGLALGYRMAVVAMQRLNVTRAENGNLVAIVESASCCADAIQCVTGCTCGKGNVVFKNYGKLALTLFSRTAHKAVRVAPFPLEDKRKKRKRGEPRKSLGGWINWTLTAVAEEVLSIEEVSIDEPVYRRRIEAVTCLSCGELVSKPHTRLKNGKRVCLSCLIADRSWEPDHSRAKGRLRRDRIMP
jgi:formylmethanofuran dehydrogenase subunit E